MLYLVELWQVAVPCMAEVLTEVFTGGHEMALHVKEEQIERIFQLISRGEAGTRIGLMQTLQSMVKVFIPLYLTLFLPHTNLYSNNGNSDNGKAKVSGLLASYPGPFKGRRKGPVHMRIIIFCKYACAHGWSLNLVYSLCVGGGLGPSYQAKPGLHHQIL